MLERLRKKEETQELDDLITQMNVEMKTYGPDSPEYPTQLNYLERLYALKAGKREGVSPDTMAVVVGNLLGILIIVAYEHKHVMTSKGLGFLLKTKTTASG